MPDLTQVESNDRECHSCPTRKLKGSCDLICTILTRQFECSILAKNGMEWSTFAWVSFGVTVTSEPLPRNHISRRIHAVRKLYKIQ